MKSLIDTMLKNTPCNMTIMWMNMNNLYIKFPQFICKMYIVWVNPYTITHTDAYFFLL